MSLEAWKTLNRKLTPRELRAAADRAYLRERGIEFVLEMRTGKIGGGKDKRSARGGGRRLGRRSWLEAVDILHEAISRILPAPHGIHVSPVFEATLRRGSVHAYQRRLDRFFNVRVPGLSFADLDEHGGNPYDLAYDLADRLDRSLGAGVVALSTPVVPFSGGVGCSNLRHNIPENDIGWAFREMDVLNAWAISDLGPGPRGAGIRIGHPDTGYSDHPDLAGPRLRIDLGCDVLDNDADARDPLRTTITNSHPGHGTSTGTLIVSSWTPGISPTQGDWVAGVAPRAELIPIRTLDSTAFVWDSDVADAVQHAIAAGSHVISLSIGGLYVPGAEAAIELAVASGCIVVCSAGQCVGKVVMPAAFPASIAIAASQEDHNPWANSSHGAAVAVCAPGEMITCTEIDEFGNVGAGRGTGTSFSCAYVAGLAALWLAHHGVETLKSALQGQSVQDAFRAAVKANVNTPAGWDAQNWGTGIVRAPSLLGNMPAAGSFPVTTPGPTPMLELIIRIFLAHILEADKASAYVLQLARTLLQTKDEKKIRSVIEYFGPELINLMLVHHELLAAHMARSKLPSASGYSKFLEKVASNRLTALTRRGHGKR